MFIFIVKKDAETGFFLQIRRLLRSVVEIVPCEKF